MRVLVSGSRDWVNYHTIKLVLDEFHAKSPITEIIHGAARGVDNFAGRWAEENKIPVRKFPAKWAEFGKAAGHIRNAEMLRDGLPEHVIAFPTGGPGTRNMIMQAKAANVPLTII